MAGTPYQETSVETSKVYLNIQSICMIEHLNIWRLPPTSQNKDQFDQELIGLILDPVRSMSHSQPIIIVTPFCGRVKNIW